MPDFTRTWGPSRITSTSCLAKGCALRAPADVGESGDFLAKGRALPRAEEGDLLAIMSAGAYGVAMASNDNARPRTAEVLVQGDRFTIVRRRETYKDLVAGETTV